MDLQRIAFGDLNQNILGQGSGQAKENVARLRGPNQTVGGFRVGGFFHFLGDSGINDGNGFDLGLLGQTQQPHSVRYDFDSHQQDSDKCDLRRKTKKSSADSAALVKPGVPAPAGRLAVMT